MGSTSQWMLILHFYFVETLQKWTRRCETRHMPWWPNKTNGLFSHPKFDRHWFSDDLISLNRFNISSTILESKIQQIKRTQSFGRRKKCSITSKHQTQIIFMFKIDESFVSHCWMRFICQRLQKRFSRIFFKMQNRFNKNEVSPKSMFASFGVCGKIFGHHGMWRISQRRVHFWGILTGYVRGAVVSFWCVRQCHRITM